MNRAFQTLMMLIAVLAFAVACKKNDDGGGGDAGTYAATPTPPVAPAQTCATPNNPNCIPPIPNYYQQNAPQFTDYQWGYANGYCGCPVGFRPVMNLNWGVSCAPYTWFPNSFYYGSATWDIQTNWYGPQNGQWTTIPQVTYSPATSGNATSCGAQASIICDTRVAGSCATGTCRPAGGGSYLGLCSTGTGNESYQYPSPQNGCMRYYSGYGWVNVCTSGTFNYNTTGGTMLPR